MNFNKLAFGLAAIGIVCALYVFFERSPRVAGHRAAAGQHEPAPDFSLPDLSGQRLSLSAYRGKVVLLDFWATWCDSCRDEIPRFVQLQNKYRDQGLQIIGVSLDDSPEPARDFYERFKMNYPVVMGNAKTGDLYGKILGLPVAFVIQRDGRVYAKHVGATPISVFENELEDLLSSSR